MDAIVARFAINFLVQLLVAYVLFIGIMIYSGDDIWPDLAGIGTGVLFDDYLDDLATEVTFEQLPFDHPLYIIFVGDDRCTQVYCSRGWWHAAAAPQGTPVAG